MIDTSNSTNLGIDMSKFYSPMSPSEFSYKKNQLMKGAIKATFKETIYMVLTATLIPGLMILLLMILLPINMVSQMSPDKPFLMLNASLMIVGVSLCMQIGMFFTVFLLIETKQLNKLTIMQYDCEGLREELSVLVGAPITQENFPDKNIYAFFSKQEPSYKIKDIETSDMSKGITFNITVENIDGNLSLIT